MSKLAIATALAAVVLSQPVMAGVNRSDTGKATLFEDLPEAERSLRVPLPIKAVPVGVILDCATLHEAQNRMQADVGKQAYSDFHVTAALLVQLARQGTCGAIIQEVSGGVSIEYPGANAIAGDILNFFENGKVVSWVRSYVTGSTQVRNFTEDGSIAQSDME